MPAAWSIDEPQTLFSLPHPIDPIAGQTRGGHVYAFSGSRKRKRTEIVVGIDGECLNVYNIKSPRLLTTHALPPHTYLTARPICAYKRATKQRPAQRIVYAATRNDLGGTARRQVLCFKEDIATPSATTEDQLKALVKYTHDITDSIDELIHIELLSKEQSADSDDTYAVLLVFSSGRISVVTENLQSEETSGHASSGRVDESSTSHTLSGVELVCTQPLADARQAGLLRDRPDLIAPLNPNSTILLLVTSSEESPTSKSRQYTIHVSSLPPSYSTFSPLSIIHPILSFRLSTSQEALATDASAIRFAYQPASATLHCLDKDAVIIFRLSGPTSKAAARFRVAQGSSSHGYLIPVSGAADLVFSSTQCALYDLCYGSAQATQTLRGSSQAAAAGRKRKRATVQESDIPFIPWFSFSGLGVVIGLEGYDIVSLGVNVKSRGKIARRGALLIESLGKAPGVPSGFDSQSSGLAELDSAWADMARRLKDLPHDEKAESLDQFFSEMLQANSNNDSPPFYERNLSLKALAVILIWRNDKVSAREPRRSPIKFAFAPRATLEWIIRHGYLTTQCVTKALSLASFSPSDSSTLVTEVDLVNAIAATDPQLALLAVFASSRRLGLSATVESFKILMSSFASTQIDDYVIGMNGSTPAATEEDLVHEQQAADAELQLAKSVLEADFSMRGAALKICLERLGTCFSLTELVGALRSQMTQREMFMLVEMLRIELEEAGWTSRRLDYHPSYNKTESQDEAIAVICRLLNCAIDAMGTVSWLADKESTEVDNVSALVTLLRAETSAVLEGVQEATFFVGFLKDFMRFEDALVGSSRSNNRGGRAAITADARLPPSMLPLGSKAVQKPATTSIGPGGEIRKRSVRDIHRENLQSLGKYEFERIRI